MNWIVIGMIMGCFFMLCDLESKVNRLLKWQKRKKNEASGLLLAPYLHRQVRLVIDNDDIQNAYLFEDYDNIIGTIEAFDDTWVLFEYTYHHQIIDQVFRIQDIVSIHEITKKEEDTSCVDVIL